MKIEMHIANEGVAKVGCLTLVGSKVPFDVKPHPDGWIITIDENSLQVFPKGTPYKAVEA